MKDLTKLLLSGVAVLTAVAQVPVVQTGIAAFVTAHPSVTSVAAFLMFVGGLLYHPAPATK